MTLIDKKKKKTLNILKICIRKSILKIIEFARFNDFKKKILAQLATCNIGFLKYLHLNIPKHVQLFQTIAP